MTATKLVEILLKGALVLGFALLGGSPGALLAMGLFRHKTAKPTFRRAMGGIVAAQLVALWFLSRHLSG